MLIHRRQKSPADNSPDDLSDKIRLGPLRRPGSQAGFSILGRDEVAIRDVAFVPAYYGPKRSLWAP